MDIVSEESQHLGKYRDKPESYIYTTCKNLRFTTERKKNLRTIEALDPFILTSSSKNVISKTSRHILPTSSLNIHENPMRTGSHNFMQTNVISSFDVAMLGG